MRLHVMSDLHLEIRNAEQRGLFWQRLRGHAPAAEGLVLAGDIGSLHRKRRRHLFEALQQFSDLYQRVFYVPGNHEFWGTGIRAGLEVLSSWEPLLPKVTFLRAGAPYRDDRIEVCGDTLWFPDCGDDRLRSVWCDYQTIPDAHAQIHRQHEKFLAQEALAPVVVTHHFPTRESIAPEWTFSDSNVFFCAYMEEWLQVSEQTYRNFLPRLWIHGHTHDPMDYRSRLGFRVYCNPLGYPGEFCNPNFWERLLVDSDPAAW